MKMDLNISKASSIMTMSCCPKSQDVICGIAWRSY